MDTPWFRIPFPITDEQDRRTLVSILAANGMEVRIIKEKPPKSTYKRFVEYRPQDEVKDEHNEER